jgi:hypothetical protein
MKCSDCGFEKNPESAHFCVGCGRRLVAVHETRIEVTQSVGHVAESGRVTAFQVEKMTGNVTMNVVQVSLPPEILAKLASVSTEVQASSTRSTTIKSAGVAATAPSPAKNPQEHDHESVHQAIADLLKVAEAQGAQAVDVGGVQTSRTELLLKKAVLLKTDAEQIMLDNAIAIARAQQSGRQPAPSVYDDRAYTAKFKEAYRLLEEALKLDAGNTEVMLHMVQIQCDTSAGDAGEAQRLLFRIQSLLNPPKDDTEKFRLAQAKYLQGVLPGSSHAPSIQAARAMFEQLGRVDWVQQCDFALRSMGAQPALNPAPNLAVFQPVGRWQVQSNDGSVALVEIYPNGSFTSTVQGGPYGYGAQSAGQWGFIPANNFLRLQGMVNGFMPFDLGIVIQGQQNGVFVATGTDGKAYFLQRLA